MKGKSNHFIDQRIGEKTSGMTEEDRIMARFTAERMRMFNKVSRHSLGYIIEYLIFIFIF